jgi:hypothetical protein
MTARNLNPAALWLCDIGTDIRAMTIVPLPIFTLDCKHITPAFT